MDNNSLTEQSDSMETQSSSDDMALSRDAATDQSEACGEGKAAGVADAGVADADSGMADADAGVAAADSGVADADSGVADADSGVADADSGVADADAGVADADSGVADADAGVADADAGVADTDAGVADAGMADADAGVAAADSGVADADAGVAAALQDAALQDVSNSTRMVILEKTRNNVFKWLWNKLTGNNSLTEQSDSMETHSSSDDMALSRENSTRMVILGKTGVGKSSLTNTIFGEQVVNIGHTLSSETITCQAVTKPVNERNITLIDSPGFFDTDRSEEDMKAEIVRCITEFAPGPHAFLIVLKVERFTEHEKAVITKIKKMFSEEFFQYATVLFTHGDQLPEGETIEDCIKTNVPVRDLVTKCGGRCYVVDNKYWKNNQQEEYRNNQVQVKELLKTIDQMMEANGGRCYTNEMLQAVQERIIQEEQVIRQSPGNKSEGEIRQEAKNRAVRWLGICLAAVKSVVLFGAFFGLRASLSVVVSAIQASVTLNRRA
ncbi:uncharacterized protein LOC117747538 [Cyclopterus lumpus]|uniref:uncharacterized protein LOC117747538 n=1 Tax=Cyclopterus lumpus TaxID=8103 RepID=UPI0014866AE7|nr:uncharacterized protein LOC117747538 [Cyclopterus lumpus]